MIKVFFSFIKEKNTLLLFLLCGFLISLALYPLLNFTINYLNEKNMAITNIYLISSMLLPSAFQSTGILINLVIDICFMCIILYPVLQVISYFLIDTPGITLLKIGRKKWINDIYKISFSYCLFISIFYMLIIISFYFYVNGILFIDTVLFISILLKVLMSLIAVYTYMIVYLLLKEVFFAYLASVGIYLLLNFFLNFFSIKYIESFIIFKYLYIIIISFVVIIYIQYYFSKKLINKLDI